MVRLLNRPDATLSAGKCGLYLADANAGSGGCAGGGGQVACASPLLSQLHRDDPYVCMLAVPSVELSTLLVQMICSGCQLHRLAVGLPSPLLQVITSNPRSSSGDNAAEGSLSPLDGSLNSVCRSGGYRGISTSHRVAGDVNRRCSRRLGEGGTSLLKLIQFSRHTALKPTALNRPHSK